MSIVYFATSNQYKFEEFSRLFALCKVELRQIVLDISEIQTMDYPSIAEAKSVEAYRQTGMPIMTEVCGIGIDALDGFPSGLNRSFWETLGPKVSTITNAIGSAAQADVWLSICDGRRIHHQSATSRGRIAHAPSSQGTFHLDQVFIPDGASQTLADMDTTERDFHSYRAKVVPNMAELLRSLRVV